MRIIHPNQDTYMYGLLAFLTCAYFVFLKPFYLREYEIPDYFVYYNFWQDRLPAKDGFSSLFILLSSTLISKYTLMHYMMLIMMAGSLLIFNIGFLRLTTNSLERLIFIFFTYSMGCWYYFYGKVFYEFPFIALNFSVLFYFSAPFLKKGADAEPFQGNCHDYAKLIALCLLSGLCLSWKAHAIFPLLGLLGLIVLNNQGLPKFLKSKILVLLFAFLLGYCIGNFNLLLYPKETLQGIRGYNSGTSFIRFMFDDSLLVWDHVNLFSFNTAILHWFTALSILVALPFLTNKGRQLVTLNLFLCALFAFFIYKFLPGWTWQGFPFSLYFIPLVAFILIHFRKNRFLTLAIIFPFFAIQAYGNFFYYIPAQIQWEWATKNAIEILKKNSREINSLVIDLTKKFPGSYLIDVKVKRKIPILGNQDPLEAGAPDLWTTIYAAQCIRPCEADYRISIEAKSMYEVSSYERLSTDRIVAIDHPKYLITFTKNLTH